MHAPADWYPDPTQRHEQRYWDGEDWTEHVFTGGVQAVDELPHAPSDAMDDAVAATADEAPPASVGPADMFTPRPSGDTAAPADDAAHAGERDLSPAPIADSEPDAWSHALPGISDAAAVADSNPAAAPEVELPEAPPSSVLGDLFIMPSDTAYDLAARAAASLDESATEPETPAAPTSDETTDGEAASGDAVTLHPELDPARISVDDERLLRMHLDGANSAFVRAGTVLATQGDLRFETAVTGRAAGQRAAMGPGMARAHGVGTVLLSDEGEVVTLVSVRGDLLVRADALLACDGSLTLEDAPRTQTPDGLTAVRVQGAGWLALVGRGLPVALAVGDASTAVHPAALAIWTAGLSLGSQPGPSGQPAMVTLAGEGMAVVLPAPGSGSDLVAPAS